jgi:hypothetical protein
MRGLLVFEIYEDACLSGTYTNRFSGYYDIDTQASADVESWLPAVILSAENVTRNILEGGTWYLEQRHVHDDEHPRYWLIQQDGHIVTGTDDDGADERAIRPVEFVAQVCRESASAAARRVAMLLCGEGSERRKTWDELVEINARAKARAKDSALARIGQLERGPVDQEPSPLDVDGVLADFIHYTTSTAEYPRPELALGAGIAMLGTVMGRKVVGPTGLGTNIYAVGIAPSSAGKDHALSTVDQLLGDADLGHLLPCSDFTSDSAVEAALQKQPAMLAQMDEIGHILRVLNKPQTASHEDRLSMCLMRLFTSTHKTYRGKAWAPSSGMEPVVIERPSLSIHGVTTPTKFFEAMGIGNVATGDLPRWLMFMPESMEKHRNRRKADMFDNSQITNRLKAMHDHLTDKGGLAALGGAGVRPQPVRVEWGSDVAEDVYEAFRDECDDRYNENPNDPMNAIVGRYAEHAVKMATIRAVARDWHALAVTADDMRWGIAVARWCGRVMIDQIKQHTKDSDDKLMDMVADAIREAGRITKSDLTYKMKGKVKARQIDAIINDLSEMDVIARMHVASGAGRKPQVYEWTGRNWVH